MLLSTSSDETFHKLHIHLRLDAMEHDFAPLKNDLLLRAAWGGFLLSVDCCVAAELRVCLVDGVAYTILCCCR